MTVTDPLASIRARLEAATPGPWKARGLESSTVVLDGSNKVLARLGDPLSGYHWNAASFIAHAREDVPVLLAALDAVMAVHEPRPDRYEQYAPDRCVECDEEYPCPTVAAVSAALGGGA